MAVKVHNKAVTFATLLINQGRINKNSAWENNKPSSDDENNYLDAHTYQEYGNWFLGIDPLLDSNTKEYYSFPIGNFKEIYKTGLIAAEQRASQYGHHDIKQAAHQLLALIK